MASASVPIGGAVGVADARLALPALAGWLTAVVLVGAADAAWAVAGAAAAVAAALAWRERGRVANRRARGGRGSGVLAASIPSVIAIAVIAAAVALVAPARTPPVIAAALDSGAAVTVVLELEQTVTPREGAAWGSSADALVVEVETSAGERVAVRVPVRVLGLSAAERMPLGSRLEGLVRLVALDPGDDRVALVRVLMPLEPVARPAPLLGAADDLRAGFLELMQPFAGDGADLLPGLAIGDTTAVGDDLDEAMKRSALSHLTAVSGANCAIVVGLVLGIGTLARWRRPVRVGVALAALAGFVVLVTPEPSVVRAAVMASVVLVALASGRPARGLPVLGVAVLGIVVLDPWISREYGFTLSVLATAALLVLAGPIAERLGRVLPAPLALWIAVPLAAQLACQPVLILLAPEVPLSGVVANVLAAPAAPVATIVGMIACLLAPVIPPLATLVAAIAWLPSAWIAGVARASSGLPGALLPWPEGAGGAVLLAGLTLAALLSLGVPVALGTRHVRRTVAIGVAATLVVVMGATVGVTALRALGRPADWVLAQCDVGQGDAVLVRSGAQVALIDTGAEPELLSSCLSSLAIDRIDLLVLTHFDLDHVGAVEVVVGRVDRAIVGPTGRAADEAVVAALLAGGAVVDTVAEGERGRLGDCDWAVLWPPAHRGIEPGNDASLVLAIEGGSCPSTVALGDLGEQSQRMLMGAYDFGVVDVVKVSHHGSPDQHLDLYRQLGAAVALIGVGAENGYGHPAPALVAELESLGSTVARSDGHGLVLVSRGADGLRLWRERASTVGVEN
ncbi:ComEC/Rec2 family competence protein [Microcella sp.]|uniref:ComEC/Rec2 family competence protein n=1 Tax=Microcella sp. TaxID=1913979 RepID=UPI00256B3BA3|nr:ComEC/Rec2 family competence protein [Microcella sp.]MBX9471035.1 ComEC/Rec2 family competence protein [Microcella sp.]